jgi:UDP-N-acetylglucosamine 2-epimerase (non-hydrolysing)
MLVDIIAGARPNFMKIAPIIDAMVSFRKKGVSIAYRLIHTGQHYDKNMSGSFFEQLGIPEPHLNLAAGGGSQAEQTAAIMVAYEKVLLNHKSQLCLVVGDVTSTMACAITAQKMHVPVAHVEAGIRSGDWNMPEEINRLVTDSITNYFFTTSTHAGKNLRNQGVSKDRIYFVGNTMIDTLLKQLPKLYPPVLYYEKGLQKGNYLVLTLHRPSNVDNPEGLMELLNEIVTNANGLPVVFPVHPRTRKNLHNINQYPQLHLIDPLSYLEFNYLVANAKAVVTDSGGVTEEATVLSVPCMTLRDTTERPETVEIGTNELLGTDKSAIAPAFEKLFSGNWKSGKIPPKWDGKTGQRIVKKLIELNGLSTS